MWRVGSRGQHNPLFQPRGWALGGGHGRWGGVSLRLSPQRGSAAGTSSSFLDPPIPSPFKGQFVTRTLPDPNLDRVDTGRASPSLCPPLASF